VDKTCVIVAVKRRNSFRWHWRMAGNDGQCSESYELYYDCFAAARAQGHQPTFQADSQPIVVR